MILLPMLLALPIGYLVRSRLAGALTLTVLFTHLYTFQTANLVMEWVNGSTQAFAATTSQATLGSTVSYLSFTSTVYAVGWVLLVLGQKLRSRRDQRDVVLAQPA